MYFEHNGREPAGVQIYIKNYNCEEKFNLLIVTIRLLVKRGHSVQTEY